MAERGSLSVGKEDTKISVFGSTKLIAFSSVILIYGAYGVTHEMNSSALYYLAPTVLVMALLGFFIHKQALLSIFLSDARRKQAARLRAKK